MYCVSCYDGAYLQATRMALWAWNCCPSTCMVTSVRMFLLRRRLKLSRTSPAWRVNWMQPSAVVAMLSKSEQGQKLYSWENLVIIIISLNEMSTVKLCGSDFHICLIRLSHFLRKKSQNSLIYFSWQTTQLSMSSRALGNTDQDFS